jgi:hypothetical protein
MDIGIAIFNILSNDTAVSAIVGYNDGSQKYRVFPLFEPQKLPVPCITYQDITNKPNNTKSGPSTLDEYSFQINSVAETTSAGTAYSIAQDLAEKVRAALDYKSGTFNGIAIDHIGYQGQHQAQWDDASRLQGVCMIAQTYLIRVQR